MARLMWLKMAKTGFALSAQSQFCFGACLRKDSFIDSTLESDVVSNLAAND